MATSIAVVRSDMKHGLTLHAPPSPIPEEPALKSDHVISFWDPWHELGLYDPVRNMMPCMGRVAVSNGGPCQSEAPIEKAADLKDVLVKIASKSPEDVSDHNLIQLLGLGLCMTCQNSGNKTKLLGLKALQYRLNIAKMHYERLDRYVDEIRKLRIYVQQLQSSPVPMASSLQATHHDREIDQLRVRINQLERENALAHTETEKIEAEAIDREAKLDRDIVKRDEFIEDLNNQLLDVDQQHQAELSDLTHSIQHNQNKIQALERQSGERLSQLEQLRAQLDLRKSKSWRRRAKCWFKMKVR